MIFHANHNTSTVAFCGPASTGEARHGSIRLVACSFLASLTIALLPTSASAQAGGAQPGASDAATQGTPESQITPPKLLEFVSATYPEEALKQGIQADVVMALLVDATGAVTEAVVQQPVGNGFDEAAQQAAMKFRFAPATRGGKPVAARILYRYRFTFEDKSKASPPASDALPPGASSGSSPSAKSPGAEQAPVQNLSGRVLSLDGDTPVAQAVIRLVPLAPVAPSGAAQPSAAVGSPRETTTDADGRWSFVSLAPGHYRVVVEAVGFESLQAQEHVTAQEVTEVVYRLNLQGVVQVVIRGERPAREVTKRTIERREIERIPGTSGDALRSLENLPGVARPPSGLGMLIVRGSAPRDTRVLIDGVHVPLAYHFGGLSSVVPTELLERIDFYPGNFSSRYGRAMGGIVDVELRAPNEDGQYHGLAQLDLIDVRGMIEGPLPFAKDWKIVAGGRRSWFDLWLKPVLNAAGTSVTVAPVYYDYQLIAETNPTPRSSLRIGFIGADDRLALISKDVDDEDATVSGSLGVATAFWRLYVRYENELSEHTRLQSTVALGRDAVDFDLGPLFFQQRGYPLTNRTELSQRLARWATMHIGLDLAGGAVDTDVRAPPLPVPGQPPQGPFAAVQMLELNRYLGWFRSGAYLEWELTPWERLRLVPGVRFDYSRDIDRWDIAPRINARYLVRNTFPKTTVKSGVGLYYRAPSMYEIYEPFGTPGLKSNRSTHTSLGVEQDITQQIDLSVEGYYKYLDHLVGGRASKAGGFDYNNLGTGYVVGAEVLLRYNPDEHFFGWIAYTLSRTILRDQPGHPERLASFDQTHILTALGSYQLGRGWQVGARYRLVSGRPETPVVGSVFDANAGSYTPLTGPMHSERIKMFRQLDLRADKTWTFTDWKLTTYLDVQNVTYVKNVEAYRYNYDFSQRDVITGLPIIPSLGVRGEF